MNHLEVHLEFGILVLEGVETMRDETRIFSPRLDKSLDVFLARRLNNASLPALRTLSPQHISLEPVSKVYPCPVKDIGCGLRYLP